MITVNSGCLLGLSAGCWDASRDQKISTSAAVTPTLLWQQCPISCPELAPSSPSLLCSCKKKTWNVKNFLENMLPPHILSSPNGLACDQIHCTGTESRREGKLCVVSRAQVHKFVWAALSPKLQSELHQQHKGLERCPQQPRALNLCCLEERGICKQHFPNHSGVCSLCKGKNMSFSWGKKKKEGWLWIVWMPATMHNLCQIMFSKNKKKLKRKWVE